MKIVRAAEKNASTGRGDSDSAALARNERRNAAPGLGGNTA
jgi:hypothetical protein